MDWGTIRSAPGRWEIQWGSHTASVTFPVMVDLHLTKRTESIGGSVGHERVPSVGEASVERRQYRTSVLSRGIVDRKVRVGGWATDNRQFGGLAVPMPDTTTDTMTMLEVLDPSRASLELVLRNPKGLCDISGLVPYQRIGKRDILGDRRGG